MQHTTPDAQQVGPPVCSKHSSVLDLSFIDGRATITVDEFAKLSGIGRTSAYAAARRGEIPVRWIGRRALIPVPLLLDWLGVSGRHPGHSSASNGQAGGSPE